MTRGTVTPSVLHALARQITAHPERSAVVEGDQHLTYAQLDETSSQVAAHLQAMSIGRGDLVLVQADRCAQLLIALLAVVKTGAAFVPLDRHLPHNRKDYIARECGARLVLSTHDQDIGPLLACEVWTINRLLAAAPAVAFEPVEVSGDQPIYVIFTSGTTGDPKGVVIEHHSVITLMLEHNRRLRVHGGSRSTWMAAVGFDLCQAEIWSNLIAGACLYVLDQQALLDSEAFLAFCVTRGISHAFVPTLKIYDLVNAPQPAGLQLEYVYTCGEKLHPVEVERLAYRVLDCYGPTETTIYVTARLVPDKRLREPASIGWPIGECKVYILDAQLQEVAVGDVGELCISGPCLARGYLNAPELTARRFINSPALGRRLYRSGDQGRLLGDGSIEFLGRMDGQVKIRGYRVEVGEIEARLLKEAQVNSAALVVDERGAQADKRLVAFVVARDPDSHPQRLIAQLRLSLEADLPEYMLPEQYHALDALPSNANGKTDKPALLRLLQQQPTDALALERFAEGTERDVAQAWFELLGHGNFTARDSFLEVGGHSLRVARLASLLSQRVGLSVSVRDIYEHLRLADLASELQRRRLPAAQLIDSAANDFERDVFLDPGTRFHAAFDAARLANPAHIMLTGASGFVGIHLLERLLATSAATLHCPVRCAQPEAGLARLQQICERYEVPITAQDWARVKVYSCDLPQPELGLEPGAYAWLCATVEVVFHSASAVNFIMPYSYMRTDNVEGLRRLLRFCGTGKTKALMLMSTISIYSWGHRFTHKRRVYEGDDIDQNLPAIRCDLGYVQSKWVMEKIADLASAQGLPLMTFRLGYATCHSRSGLCAHYQWWGRFIQTCLEFGAVPDLRKMREGLTTVDYMSAAVAHIARQPAALGKKFNLCQPLQTDLDLKQFCRQVADYYGRNLAVIPFKRWVGLWAGDEQALLYPLLGMFTDPMADGATILELYQHNYAWDRSNTRRFLNGSDIEPVALTDEVLGRYLARLRR
jgi:amino acid adenylation domain-containing protein/thioester reductase-like protein